MSRSYSLWTFGTSKLSNNAVVGRRKPAGIVSWSCEMTASSWASFPPWTRLAYQSLLNLSSKPMYSTKKPLHPATSSVSNTGYRLSNLTKAPSPQGRPRFVPGTASRHVAGLNRKTSTAFTNPGDRPQFVTTRSR